MSIFTKEEKLNINKKTGRSTWITTKKGITIPGISRKQPTPMDLKVKSFQKQQRATRKTARSKKIAGYKKKWHNVQDALERNINPDLFDMGGSRSSIPSTPKKKTSSKKKGKPDYIIRDGVAYKVAGTGKPKKKKKKKSSSSPSSSDWLDPFDFDMGGDLF